jgi:predicted dinucleotide-binding enzyme
MVQNQIILNQNQLPVTIKPTDQVLHITEVRVKVVRREHTERRLHQKNQVAIQAVRHHGAAAAAEVVVLLIPAVHEVREVPAAHEVRAVQVVLEVLEDHAPALHHQAADN